MAHGLTAEQSQRAKAGARARLRAGRRFTLAYIEGRRGANATELCAALKFAPKFEASTKAKTSKANGASLSVKLSYPNAP